MKYKTPDCCEQLRQSCKRLVQVTYFFETLSIKHAGVEPTITRVWDAVCGDSGVHQDKRAVDIRDEVRSDGGTKFLYTDEQVQQIVNEMNAAFPRKDDKLTCLSHSFQGGPRHFHLQIEAKWLDPKRDITKLDKWEVSNQEGSLS